MAATNEANLVPTSHVRLSLSKPRKLPGETDSWTNIVPVLWVDRFIGLGSFRADKLEFRHKVQIDAVIWSQPTVETSSRNSQQSESASVLRNDAQSLPFVRNAVIFVTQAEVKR